MNAISLWPRLTRWRMAFLMPWGVIDGNPRAPYGRTVRTDCHGRNSRRFARGGIDQQQALCPAVAESFNRPLEKFGDQRWEEMKDVYPVFNRRRSKPLSTAASKPFFKSGAITPIR